VDKEVMIPFRVILLFWRSLYSEMTRSTFLGVGVWGGSVSLRFAPFNRNCLAIRVS